MQGGADNTMYRREDLDPERQKQLLSITLASIGDGVIVTDSQGKVVFLNAEAERLTGWTNQEASGQPLLTVFRIINEETRLPAESPAEKVLREGAIVGLANHTALLGKDGREIPINDSGAPVKDADGTIHGVVLVFRDFSEQKRAMVSLARLASIVECSDDAIVSKDLNGTILTWNKTAERMFGYTSEQAVGKSIKMLLPPDRLQEEEYILQRLRAGERIEHYETVRMTRKGRLIDVSITISPLKDNDGHVNGASKIVRDITSRKRAEEALRRQAKLLDLSGEAIFVWELGGAIEYWNAGAVMLYGYSRNEAVGRISHELLATVHPQGTEWFLGELKRNRHWRGELSHRTKDGRIITVETRQQLIYQGKRRLVLETNRDITARKRAEESLLRLNETLEEHVMERTAQLRALAAELTKTEEEERRKLAQILHDQLQQLLVAAKMKVSQAFNKAQDETMRQLLDQIESLLLQSIEQSRSLTAELSPPILYQSGLAAGLEWLGRWMLEKHGLTLDLDVTGSLSSVTDDLKAFLFRSVHELLFNVVKHAGVDRAHVEVLADPSRLRITVADNGLGMNPAAARDGKKSHGGFGLFSIRERLTYMDGKMGIDGVTGRGTRITMEIPVQQEQTLAEQTEQAAAAWPNETEPKQSQASAKINSRIRVLLADDHKIVREGLKSLLAEQPGIEVVGQAEDGQVALEMARVLHPDVVVMDVSMPRMDGLEATRRLKAEMLDVNVIGLSMHSESDMALSMKKAGAVAYLNKVGPAEKLIETIRSCPVHHSWFPSI
jgi:PAS domain S-box-containing protein